jgi:hypothetical protein
MVEQNKMIIFGLAIGVLIALAMFYGTNLGQAWVGISPTAPSPQIQLYNAHPTLCLFPSTQAEYTTANYNYNGKTYTVEVVVIPDNANPATANFKVNGETTGALTVGQSYKLTSGISINVRSIKLNPDTVAFCLI